MLVKVFVKKTKSGEYTNTSFRLQGENLRGMIPIRVCYFGKPVKEPVMEKLLDPVTKKPKLDENGKETFVEKLDEQGNVVMETKKNADGKEILRDDNYFDRVELLSMFSGDYETGEVAQSVSLIAKKKNVVAEDGVKFNYFLVCGNEQVPIEVPDFSTEERPDYRYKANCKALSAIAELL